MHLFAFVVVVVALLDHPLQMPAKRKAATKTEAVDSNAAPSADKKSKNTKGAAEATATAAAPAASASASASASGSAGDWKNGSGKRKVALITGITGQDGSYLAEFLLAKVMR